MLNAYFADMHIHIGRDIYDKPVKITGAKTLTLTNILKESSRNKGINLIGVIDSHAPAVQQEIEQLIEADKAYELSDGGIRFEKVTLLLGSEIEVYDEHCHGPIHVLCYFPSLEKIKRFSEWLTTKMKNITLSSQRYYGTAKELQYKVKELGGIFIPAHVFTPFKSLYGKGVIKSLEEVLDPDLIDAIELGLSSDTEMADQIKELHNYTFVSNSDAHSLAKIAREYQEIYMETPSFKEFYWALHQVNGRKIKQNFGMNPQLGKYHTTVCNNCMEVLSPDASKCSACGSTKITKGVFDRIQELKDAIEVETDRPPYLYQVPLEYLPTLGKKTFQKLLDHFGTEMNVIHYATLEQLKEVIPEKLAISIMEMREGQLKIKAGGGGKYGSITSS
ncbi:TIGR00375 family protein [Virgibacillus profundi]|uniref:TIGR00375 family protein n=1 Tax=Virgibacillus profundi TaxID=2024555 RepID=A0A2A2IEI0_9BACI|nr:endonuclease Q family protein [Virgibacillus profundi]PAV29560.1 TIGR00375 family protein [Virgibacillus profundi]PXY53730.1 TIGR00375 family protein [Virgibacillus profundi]